MHQADAIFVSNHRVSSQFENGQKHVTILLTRKMQCRPLVIRQRLLVDPIHNSLVDLLLNLLFGQECSLHTVLDVLIGLLENKPATLPEVVHQELQNLNISVIGALVNQGVAKPVNCEDELVYLHLGHLLADLNEGRHVLVRESLD